MIALLLLACADPAPTLAAVQTEVFDASCAFSSCHGSGAGGLDLTAAASHAALVDVESEAAPGEFRVVAGDSAASYLVKKCGSEAGIVGEPMPNLDGLDAERLAMLSAWIDAGALAD